MVRGRSLRRGHVDRSRGDSGAGRRRGLNAGREVSASGGNLQVGEWGTGRFPAFCPERHANEGATFCLGHGIDRSVLTLDDAIVWWELLGRFLSLQRVAERTGRWPSGHAIAHGDAGPHHVAARRIAAELSILEAYDEGLLEGDH